MAASVWCSRLPNKDFTIVPRMFRRMVRRRIHTYSNEAYRQVDECLTLKAGTPLSMFALLARPRDSDFFFVLILR